MISSLYPGQKCTEGAKWCPIAVPTDANEMHVTTRASALPPPGTAAQLPSLPRPGNNVVVMPGLTVAAGFISCPGRG